jgi:hypothetical protein
VDVVIFGIYGESRLDSGDVGLTGGAWQAVQQQQLNDRDVQGLAETLRELVGLASDCPVAEIKGTPLVIQSIERLAFEVASLIDEYTKNSFMGRYLPLECYVCSHDISARLGKAQITDIKARITGCQVELKDLYVKLRTRIIAYTAKHVKEMREDMEELQDDAKRRDAQKFCTYEYCFASSFHFLR